MKMTRLAIATLLIVATSAIDVVRHGRTLRTAAKHHQKVGNGCRHASVKKNAKACCEKPECAWMKTTAMDRSNTEAQCWDKSTTGTNMCMDLHYCKPPCAVDNPSELLEALEAALKIAETKLEKSTKALLKADKERDEAAGTHVDATGAAEKAKQAAAQSTKSVEDATTALDTEGVMDSANQYNDATQLYLKQRQRGFFTRVGDVMSGGDFRDDKALENQNKQAKITTAKHEEYKAAQQKVKELMAKDGENKVAVEAAQKEVGKAKQAWEDATATAGNAKALKTQHEADVTTATAARDAEVAARAARAASFDQCFAACSKMLAEIEASPYAAPIIAAVVSSAV